MRRAGSTVSSPRITSASWGEARRNTGASFITACNVDAVEVLREGLETAGHKVTIALDGPSAIAAAAEVNPEVGVLDIGLPGMDGYELARRLRRSHPSMRLIALTGYGQRSDIDAAMRAGFDVHCTKPVRLASLLEQIEARRTLVA